MKSAGALPVKISCSIEICYNVTVCVPMDLAGFIVDFCYEQQECYEQEVPCGSLPV